mmetsp:Transcript_26621/g.66698  ORF Transcript_26621/g.66698 Transcript_26621/m.66698 type:complete len:214 (-) Transcript_26621:56-697(-)
MAPHWRSTSNERPALPRCWLFRFPTPGWLCAATFPPITMYRASCDAPCRRMTSPRASHRTALAAQRTCRRVAGSRARKKARPRVHASRTSRSADERGGSDVTPARFFFLVFFRSRAAVSVSMRTHSVARITNPGSLDLGSLIDGECSLPPTSSSSETASAAPRKAAGSAMPCIICISRDGGSVSARASSPSSVAPSSCRSRSKGKRHPRGFRV